AGSAPSASTATRRARSRSSASCSIESGISASGNDGLHRTGLHLRGRKRPSTIPLPAGAEEDEDVLRLTTIVSQRVQSLLERRESTKDGDPAPTVELAIGSRSKHRPVRANLGVEVRS